VIRDSRGCHGSAAGSDVGATAPPLCVACDGTLVRNNLVLEGMLQLTRRNFWYVARFIVWMFRGMAVLKSQVARRTALAASALNYNGELVQFLRSEHSAGRKLILVTGCPLDFAKVVADELGLFSEVHASTPQTNLTPHRQRELLCSRFGERGYEYAGSRVRELTVWSTAVAAVLVGVRRAVARSVAKHTAITRSFPRAAPQLTTYLRALRVHQWLKNLLVFVPLVVSHQVFSARLATASAIAFVSFSICASSVYIWNDLLDMAADRMHPRKRLRPFAAGELSVVQGVMLAAACLGAAVLLCSQLPRPFWWLLGTYLLTTSTYSLALKNRPIVDVILLAGLYTIRLLAGSAATAIYPSFWLLAFSMFIFLSLATAKRYAELIVMTNAGTRALHGRGYRADDLPLLMSIGTANGFLAVLVLALYVNSSEVAALYRSPAILWLIPPLMLYWVSRVWLKTHRGEMHDDPIVFAVKDRPSLAVGLSLVAVLVASTLYSG